MMLTHTLESKNTPPPDGWSREPDGTLVMEPTRAVGLFVQLQARKVPAYAVNLVYEPGMEFEAWLNKNGIQFPDSSPIE